MFQQYFTKSLQHVWRYLRMDLTEINTVAPHSNHKLVGKLQMDEHHWRREKWNYLASSRC